MSKDPWNLPTDNLSLTNILHKSVRIHSNTIIHRDGKVQSFCGLKIANVGETSAAIESINAPVTNQLLAPSTSRKPSGQLHSRTSGQLTTPLTHKTSRRAAYTSSGISVSYRSLGPATYQCPHCRAYMWYEERANKAKNAKNPTFSICCQEGKVRLAKFHDAPPPLNKLLDYTDPATSKFREKIRVYNSMFCFTSFGARIDHSINTGRAPYTFRINGQNYHRIGSLLPQEGVQPRYAQLYFFDTENEVRNRMSAFTEKETLEGIEPSIVQRLIEMLNQSSAVAKAFRMVRNWCCSRQSTNVQLKLLGERATAMQYNKPTVAEVAALITNDFGDGIPIRDVIVDTKDNGLQRISELHASYMALQYPLLFPYGEDGFHEKIPYHTNKGSRKTNREFVTMKEYYAYIIQQRNDQGTTLLRGGRLYQQYLVDAFTTVEEQRLKWSRNNQDTLRADLYHNVTDAVTRGDTNAEGLGKRIVLAGTFTGSPRYMMSNYQDAMALCRTYGNPDLFITFTSNPKWPEIAEMLSYLPGQKPHDRPEIGTRVFKLKLTLLLEDLTKNRIFGECRAIIYVVEFQKRGLPHVHILLWLEEHCRCNTPSQIDDIISAEIPLQAEDPEGYKAVTEFMLHGPCGKDAKSAPCNVEEKCSKHFPKAFNEETIIDADGYPIYRRRDNKSSITKGKYKYDNKNVVPHNRYLLLKYQAHINVEWCNQSKAIKYLFKYLNKGPDRASIVVEENVKKGDAVQGKTIIEVDEIKSYLNCRYLAPCEAVWRLFSFDIHYSYPSVMKLNFHMPNQQVVTMRDADHLPALLQREGIDVTMFTDWFELNKRDPSARTLTYAEIPKKFVWHEKEKMWKQRKQQKCIGRIVYSSPASGERYYLRMLLNVVRGPQEYVELMTVNKRVHPTFKETYFAYGLLNDDKEWRHAISEASLWALGPQLRDMFVTILIFCKVSRPQQLWNESWKAMSEDILYRKQRLFNYPELRLSNEQLQNYCIMEIKELLNRHGRDLSDFPELPKPNPELLTNMENRLIREALAFDMNKSRIEHQELHALLNPEQRLIYAHVLSSVHNQQGQFYFIYGPGGTGKTFLYRTLMARLRSEGMIVLAVASSGIASLLLPGDITAHSRFVIPLELMENSTCGIKQNTHLAELMQQVKLIIWDEAPMTQKYAFEALDTTLRDILGYKNPQKREQLFGGTTVVLGGDFRQILPVIPKGKRADIVHSCINRSHLWKHCKVFTLTRSMRVNEYYDNGEIDTRKQDFNKWVLAVGNGTVPAKKKQGDDEATWIEIPERFLIKTWTNPIEKIVEETYPDFTTRRHDDTYLKERAILTPRNDDAGAINAYMFKKLGGETMTYKSADEICMASTDTLNQHNLYPVEFLNTLNFLGMPPHSLCLKKDLPIMLIRNINPRKGLCNGTRLIITKLDQFIIWARILTGSHVGEIVVIHRIIVSSTQTKWPFVTEDNSQSSHATR